MQAQYKRCLAENSPLSPSWCLWDLHKVGHTLQLLQICWVPDYPHKYSLCILATWGVLISALLLHPDARSWEGVIWEFLFPTHPQIHLIPCLEGTRVKQNKQGISLLYRAVLQLNRINWWRVKNTRLKRLGFCVDKWSESDNTVHCSDAHKSCCTNQTNQA